MAERQGYRKSEIRYSAYSDPYRPGTSECDAPRPILLSLQIDAPTFESREELQGRFLGRLSFLNSPTSITTTTSRPCRVIVCGPAVRASSITRLNWFFATCTGHLFMSQSLTPILASQARSSALIMARSGGRHGLEFSSRMLGGSRPQAISRLGRSIRSVSQLRLW